MYWNTYETCLLKGISWIKQKIRTNADCRSEQLTSERLNPKHKKFPYTDSKHPHITSISKPSEVYWLRSHPFYGESSLRCCKIDGLSDLIFTIRLQTLTASCPWKIFKHIRKVCHILREKNYKTTIHRFGRSDVVDIFTLIIDRYNDRYR